MSAVQLGEQWFDYADVLIDVMIGYACNVQCDYCSITDEMRQENMTIAAVMAQLRDARARGATKVAFGGGEPTIRRGLLPLVRWCRDRGYQLDQDPVERPDVLVPRLRQGGERGRHHRLPHLVHGAHRRRSTSTIMGRPDAFALVNAGRAQPARARPQAGRRPDHQAATPGCTSPTSSSTGPAQGIDDVQPLAGVAVGPQQGQPRLAAAGHRDARRHLRRLRARPAARRHGALAPHPALHAARLRGHTSPICARTRCW